MKFWALVLIWGITLCGCGGSGSTSANGNSSQNPTEIPPTIIFNFTNNKLYIETSTMTLTIEGAAVVYVKDKASGEVLVDTSAWINRPSFSGGFMPAQSSGVAFQTINANQGRLTYSLSGGQLLVDVTVDSAGEMIIQLTGTGSGITDAIDLPIMNFAKSSVILGSGAKYVRSDPDHVDYAKYEYQGLYSPVVAVAEGTNSVLAAWSETTTFGPENIELQHYTSYDHIILQGGKDLENTDPQKIVSSPWRIGTYAAWNLAAKRWRVKFEERTGAKPLWENRAPWVRNVHATYYGTSNWYGLRYDELATKVPPQKLLMFLWNGDRIVLFGDHRVASVIGIPTPEAMRTIKSYGWPTILYHPWMLIGTESGNAARLQDLSSKGWLPAGYNFTPDYGGTPENWQNYWSGLKTSYYNCPECQGYDAYVLHPGSTKFKDYLIRNYGDYCAYYGVNGAYLDVLGFNVEALFPDSIKVIEGQNYAAGEVNAIARVTSALPNLAIMSECTNPWLLPYIWYSWEGPESHSVRNSLVSTRTNHPLRAALMSSYTWTREDNKSYIDDVASALLGSLPELSLVGDLNVTQDRALWSQQRAKLFTDYDLFNDVPDNWDADALAYYRSNTGNWFKFIQAGSDFQYIEILPSGTQLIRLSKSGGYVPPP
jgi:hypothetical protein